jgi:hypothetical protein
MNNEFKKKDVVKSRRDVMPGNIRHLPGGTEKSTKNVCDSRS